MPQFILAIKSKVGSLLPSNSFARSVSLLVGGTLGAQTITVLSAPLLTRLYSPEDFGLLAVFVALVSTVTVIASLRYQLAIPLPENQKDAATIVLLSLLIVLIISFLLSLLAWTSGDILTRWLKMPQLHGYLWLVPVATLLGGAYQVFSYWLTRNQDFHLIAETKFTQSFCATSIQIVGYSFGPIALLLGQVVNHAAGVTSLARHSFKYLASTYKEITYSDVIAQARRYRNFPLYSTWSGLFNTVGAQLPPILFAALFSPAAAGIFALTYRVLSAPMTLLGQAVAQVFYSRASEANRNGQLGDLVADIHAKLSHVAMPPALALIIAGPDLFAWGFGNEWRSAGVFARWMAPWLYMVFVTSPLSNLFSVMENQIFDMYFQTVLLITRIASIFLGAWAKGLEGAVALFSASSAICWAVFLVWVLRSSNNSWRSLWVPTVHSLAWGSLIVTPYLFSIAVSESTFSRYCATALSIALGALRYYLLLKAAYSPPTTRSLQC